MSSTGDGYVDASDPAASIAQQVQHGWRDISIHVAHPWQWVGVLEDLVETRILDSQHLRHWGHDWSRADVGRHVSLYVSHMCGSAGLGLPDRIDPDASWCELNCERSSQTLNSSFRHGVYCQMLLYDFDALCSKRGNHDDAPRRVGLSQMIAE